MDAACTIFYEKIHLETRASMKVLYLSEWYPNRYDYSSGRFVRGHAISAVKQGVDICVLFLYKIPKGDSEALFSQETNGTKEVYVYYQGSYLSALYKGWKYVQQYWGTPDICQLNVLTKNAFLPIWLKITHGIPYIIVEHWTGYYPEAAAFKGLMRHLFAQVVARNAQMILTVSSELAEHMQRHGLKNKDYRIICNVVYDMFFQEQERKKDDIKRMLHVSFFDDDHKNVSDIIRAVGLLAKQHKDFECVIVGDGKDRDKLHSLVDELAIPQKMIQWTGEIAPQQVCELFYQSDFFVFYSNYETAGIVLTESLICGKPIITTPVGIAPDIITKETGLIVPKRQPEKLAEAINWMLDHYQDYHPEQLRKMGQQYSEENVGKYLKSIYREILA